MARLIWVGLGAAGGIYAYRKGEQVVEAVRGQGVAGTAHLVTATALNLMRSADAPLAVPQAAPHRRAPGHGEGLRVGRFRITRADEPAPPSGPAAIMDTGVVDITDAAVSRGTVVSQRRKAR